MNAIVIYDSQYGNTERIAQTIADAVRTFGQVRAIHIDSAHAAELEGVDMLIVGCPTQGWNATPAMLSFLEHIASERLSGMAVACFDTRFQKPRWLTGSAAKVMARQLRKRGAALLAPPESFFVMGKEGPLADGELERAAMWARTIVEAVAAARPAVR